MKSNIVTTILLIVSFSSFSQTKGPGLKISFQPNYSNIPNKGIISNSNPYDFKLSGTISAQLAYTINEHLDLYAGIGYVNKGYQYERSDLRFGSQHNGMGQFDPSLPSGEDFDAIKAKTQYHYVGLPIEFAYRFRAVPQSFYGIVGLTPIYHVSTKTQQGLYKEGDYVRTTNDKHDSSFYRSLNVQLQVGLGKAFPLNDNLSLFLEGRFDWFVLEPVKLSSDGKKWNGLYSFGIGTGLVIQ